MKLGCYAVLICVQFVQKYLERTKPFVVGLVVIVFTGLTILRGFGWADKRRDLYPRGLITGIKKPF